MTQSITSLFTLIQDLVVVAVIVGIVSGVLLLAAQSFAGWRHNGR